MNRTNESSEDLKSIKKIEKELEDTDKQIVQLQCKKNTLLKQKEDLLSSIQHKKGLELSKQKWDSTDYPWSNRLKTVLETKFLVPKLREFQLPTMNAILSKHDCLLIMPTGGGKSLCFQAPSLVSKGVTLVVSPLVSLMEDQCMALKRLKIDAEMMSSSLTRKEVNNIYKKMVDKDSSLKLLYVTPEKLAKSKQFMTKLQKMHQLDRLSILAIDEVHCCSHWGHDFRPDFKFLGIMKRQFPKVSILGLTATATEEVLQDVKKILNIESCLVFKAEFNRPNLKYEIHDKSASLKESVQDIINLINHRFNSMSGIVYCCSVKETEDVAKELRQCGIKAACYHAQMEIHDRSKVHHEWSAGTLNVIVATIAFGMGIDKPNVRFVIHHSISKSLENYYQESGRAGRDDKYAECILLYRFNDMSRQSSLIFSEQKGLDKLYSMIAYCIDVKRCRRAIIADYFATKWELSNCNDMCDHCVTAKTDSVREKDISKHFADICSILRQAENSAERITGTMLVDAWLGKGQLKHRVKNVKTILPRVTCERITAFLIIEHYLVEDFHFTPYNTISYLKIGSRRNDGSGIMWYTKAGNSKSSESSNSVSQINKESNSGKVEAKLKSKPASTNNAKSERPKTSKRSNSNLSPITANKKLKSETITID